MATPPRRRPLPITPQSIRRSFTAPVELYPSPQPQHVDPSDAAADILYSHPSTKTFSFSPPDANKIKPASLDADYPVDAIETLPWSAPRESMEAQGSLIIEKVRGSATFLKTGKIVHAIMRGSQCWCVDGDSKFVLRVRQFQYYRIEFPNRTAEEREKIEDLKTVLRKILKFEVTPCPFMRAFKVELPESASTPKKKKAWQPRTSLSKESPLSLTSSVAGVEDRPESRNSSISDALTDGEQGDGSDSSRSTLHSTSGSVHEDTKSVERTETHDREDGQVVSFEEQQNVGPDNAPPDKPLDLQVEDLESPGSLSQASEKHEVHEGDITSAESSEPPDHHTSPDLQVESNQDIEVNNGDSQEEGDNISHPLQVPDKSQQEAPVSASADSPAEMKDEEVVSLENVVEKSATSPSLVDPTDFGLETGEVIPNMDSASPIAIQSSPRQRSLSDQSLVKEESLSASVDSFHSINSHRSSKSSLVSYSQPDVTLLTPSPQRRISEVTMRNERAEPNDLAASDASDQPETPKLLHDSASDAEWPEVQTPAPNEAVKRRMPRKRSGFSPLPPASTLLGSSPRSSDRHLATALIQKAASLAVGKPLEAVILLFHVLGRIAAGATVNDLISGELFRRPQREEKDSATSSGRSRNSLDEDDYNHPIRGRSRNTYRENHESDLD